MTAKSILFLTPESDILKNITHFLLAKNMLPPPRKFVKLIYYKIHRVVDTIC